MKKNMYDYGFVALLSLLGLYALTNFYSYMDNYEVAILVSSVAGFSYLGIKWARFRYFFIASFVLTFLSIYLYQGDLGQSESKFLLKYILSSQSAIMWMTALFPLSLLIYWFYLFSKKEFYGNFATCMVWIAVVFASAGLLIRWFESYLIDVEVGHIPVSNLYEVFILFCLIASLIYLFYEEKLNTKKLGPFVLIVINAAVGFLLWYTLAKNADVIQPLVPALQSYWMKIHVPANFIGYGAFSVAAMVSVAYLLTENIFWRRHLPAKEILDEMTYRLIAIGFIFFTIATILGAVWAAEAWGGYW